LAQADLRLGIDGWSFGGAALPGRAPRGGRARLAGDVPRDRVEPVGDRLLPALGGSAPGEDEECRLEGVLGILLTAQHSATDTEDHRSMAADERREGVLVALTGETPQQLAVGRRGGALCRQAAKVLQEGAG